MPGRAGALSIMRASYSASPSPFPPGRTTGRLGPSKATRCPMSDSPTWPARLDHVRLDSDDPARLAPMLRFYEQVLGWTVSDYVMEGEGAARTPTVGFFRSDPEHHSFAVFRCPETRPDHHSYEAGDWNAIRDWADHMASLGIK